MADERAKVVAEATATYKICRYLKKDMYGPQDSLVVQKRGGEGGGVSYLCRELPGIPYGEVIDACSRVGLERGHEGGVLRPLPPKKGIACT